MHLMASRTLTYYLVKIARASGWLLFLLVSLYIVTGWSLCNEPGYPKLLEAKTALVIHKLFDWPLMAVFGVHCCVTIYFAMRRWGWIRKRTQK
jgi:succinate dehydrogenase/fumarate reductase cytochrome b subunit